MITVVATTTFRPETLAQAMAVLERLVETTRGEPGCLRYDLFRNRARPETVTMIEEWADQAALQTHGASASFRAALAQLGPWAAAASDMMVLEPVSVSARGIQ